MKFVHIILAIIVLGLVAYGGFVLLFATRTGAVDSNTPFFGPIVSEITPGLTAHLLVIGAPSPELSAVLNANTDLVGKPIIIPANAVQANIESQIDQADIIIFDQTGKTSREIPRELGDTLQNYVKTGGKLIVIGDSGTAQTESTKWGWKTNFGNAVPIACADSTAPDSCKTPLVVLGVIWRTDDKHPIMQGIERVPAEAGIGYLALSTFDITTTANEIAQLEDAKTGNKYPAIVEETFLGGGKMIYFNYNPGITAGIMENTIKYLK